MQTSKLKTLQNNIVKLMLDNIVSNKAKSTLSSQWLAVDKINLMSALMLEKYADNISQVLPITASYLKSLGEYNKIIAIFLKKHPPQNISFFYNAKSFYKFSKNFYLFKLSKYRYLSSILRYEISIAIIKNYVDNTDIKGGEPHFHLDKSIKLLKLDFDISQCVKTRYFVNNFIIQRKVYLALLWDSKAQHIKAFELNKYSYDSLFRLKNLCALTKCYLALWQKLLLMGIVEEE